MADPRIIKGKKVIERFSPFTIASIGSKVVKAAARKGKIDMLEILKAYLNLAILSSFFRIETADKENSKNCEKLVQSVAGGCPLWGSKCCVEAVERLLISY